MTTLAAAITCTISPHAWDDLNKQLWFIKSSENDFLVPFAGLETQ